MKHVQYKKQREKEKES